uniref:Oxidoreductase n=1 Tax=Thermosporothrix sp. COM3 TaxID=2490863 RepID=A0A455SK38_9CHLR|nr:oxidoreductase [Thermosporothrix sp. COM3]
MQYTRLGNTGLVVSRLAFGAMTFGSGQGAFASVYKVGQEEANRLVAGALDAGVTFFNTADAYADGQSEEMLGRALGSHRKDVVIATKVGMRTGEALLHAGLSRQHIIAQAQASLKRLQTDYIDLYLVHCIDPYTPLEETLEALDYLVRQGMVRYIGFSNWPAWMAAKAVGLQQANHWAQFRAAEVYYSLVGRDVEHEIVPFTRDAGIGVLVWSPLAGGFLSGKYSREQPQQQEGRLSGFDIIPFNREHGYDVVDLLKSIASKHGATPAQVALAWLLSRRHVTSLLVGASKVQQLEENLVAAQVQLSADELAELDKLTAPQQPYPNWFIANVKDPAREEALGS